MVGLHHHSNCAGIWFSNGLAPGRVIDWLLSTRGQQRTMSFNISYIVLVMQVCAFENLLFTAAHSKRLETHTLETFVIYPGLPDVKNTAFVFTAGCSERVTITTLSNRSFDVH